MTSSTTKSTAGIDGSPARRSSLWSHTGPVAAWYEPLEVWKAWADDVDGGPVAAGHFIPEEAPDETTRRLVDFLC